LAGGSPRVSSLKQLRFAASPKPLTTFKYKGKIVVVAQQKLQGVFVHFEEARKVASRFRVAHTFLVDRKPMEKIIELSPEMEVL